MPHWGNAINWQRSRVMSAIDDRSNECLVYYLILFDALESDLITFHDGIDANAHYSSP